MADRLRDGETLYTAWSSIPENGLVDHLGTTDFDAITLDMQHGGHNEQSVLNCLATIIRRQKIGLIRVPVGRNDMCSRALDMGAEAVIAPMINSLDDAKAFAGAMKYPPMGERSWGATRAVSVRGITGGNDYLRSANKSTVSIAMIETRDALAALDDILALEGIDGVFMGPADFSIAWTNGGEVNPALEDMMAGVEQVAQSAKQAGKFAGVFAMNPKMAPRYAAMGYQLIAVGFDTSFITEGAGSFLKTARGEGQADLDGGY